MSTFHPTKNSRTFETEANGMEMKTGLLVEWKVPIIIFSKVLMLAILSNNMQARQIATTITESQLNHKHIQQNLLPVFLSIDCYTIICQTSLSKIY